MISNNKALLTSRSAPNVDEGIESDSTIKQKNNDESIDDSKGVGTKGGYSVNSVGTISAGVDVGVLFNNKVVSTKGIKGDVSQSLPVIRSSLVTTSIVLDESVFSNKTVGIDPSGDSTGSIQVDAVWTVSRLRVGGGDPVGINSTNIWLNNSEGRTWLKRIDREKIILQSIHNIYGDSGYNNQDENKNEIESCDNSHIPNEGLHILETASNN
jgi:hypothetical protein